MNKEDIKRIFEDDELMLQFCNFFADEGFFNTDKEPVYTLRECLETIDEDILDAIYQVNRQILVRDKKLKNNPSKEEKIDTLEKETLRLFPEFLTTLNGDDRNILNKGLKNKELKQSNITLLSNGYMYGFKRNNELVYVIPTEFLTMYKEYIDTDENQKRDYNEAILNTTAYILMNGIIPKDFIKNVLLNEYAFNITEEQFQEIASTFNEYQDYYTTFDVNEDTTELLDEIIRTKHEIGDIYILEKEEMNEYLNVIYHLYNELSKTTKDKRRIDEIMMKIFTTNVPIEDILKAINLNKAETKKVTKFHQEYKDKIRYWIYNGRTKDEFERHLWLTIPSFDKKPKFTDLHSCLENMDKEIYEDIKSNFNNDESLEENIIKYAKEKAKEYHIIQLVNFLNLNDEEPNNNTTKEQLCHGLIYLYKENDKIKCLIPDEILDIMDEAYYMKQDKDDCIEDLVSIYIDMNGLITKQKLQELLKEYHDIDLSIKELDEIVKEAGAFIIKNKYYTWVTDSPMEDLEDMLILKDLFPKYQKADFERDDKENEFKEKVRDILGNYLTDEKEIANAHTMIVLPCKNGVLKKGLLDELLETRKINLNEKAKKQILDLYKEYKKYISVWIYNGYTVLEQADVINQKSIKVGRNDPCPCGSGKKYKKCCGK